MTGWDPRPCREIATEALDWRSILGPDDLLIFGQASAEPVTLTGSLMAARATLPPFRVFIGMSFGNSVDPRHGDCVRFLSYCGTGRNGNMGTALEILPIHYGDIAPALSKERPIVLVSLAEGRDDQHFSVGAGCDYVFDLMESARLVIAEISTRNPRSTTQIPRSAIDMFVRTAAPPPVQFGAPSGAVESAIAERIAGMIEDGSTLQIGLGRIPAAVLASLTRHRDLGIHSGLICDEVAELAEMGIVNNSRKSLDRGISVAGLLAGSQRLLWEVAGAAHLSSYGAYEAPDLSARDGIPSIGSSPMVNILPVVEAACLQMVRWIDEGVAPRRQRPIEVLADGSGIQLDPFGNAVGGVRLPELEAPTATYDASRPPQVGTRIPFSTGRLKALYPSSDIYVAKVRAAATKAVDDGVILQHRADQYTAAAAKGFEARA